MQAHFPGFYQPMVCDQDDFYSSEKAPSRVIRARSKGEDHREQLLGEEVRRRAVQSIDIARGVYQQNMAFSHQLCVREICFRGVEQG